MSCADEVEQSRYSDPISGDESIFETVSLDGWKLHKNGDDSGETILLEKDGDLVAIVQEMPGYERQISIDSDDKSITIQLTDNGADGSWDQLIYGNGEVEVIDSRLDGKIEVFRFFEPRKVLVPYREKMLTLESKGSGEYYVVYDGEEICMEYKERIFIVCDRQ